MATAVTKPVERIAHPELIRECGEDGKGWRVNEYGDWFPCEGEKLKATDGARS